MFRTIALAALSVTCFVSVASADVIFDNLPAVLPGNVPSWGYQANQTAEFGNSVAFAGTARDLTNVRVVLSDWAKKIDYPSVGDATGYDHDITLNIYDVGTGGTPGALIGTKTSTVHVPWHTAVPFNGTAFNVDFDFTGTTVPDSAIFSVAYATSQRGGLEEGPYNSLNYGFANATPSVGTDINPDEVYMDTTVTSLYTDGGAGGVGILRTDTGWNNYVPSLQVSAVPEPTAMGALGLGALALVRRRRA